MKTLPLPRLLASTCFAIGMMAGAAQAQSLTMNITDTGYDPIPAGGEINYAVRIQNGGNSRADARDIDFTIPANSTYTGISGGLLNCSPEPEIQGEASITCQIPSLAPREEVTATVQVVPTVAGTIPFQGRIDGQSMIGENTTVMVGADLELEFTAPPSIQAGDFLSFQAVITNHGPYEGVRTSFTMLLPSALSPQITLPAGCSISGNTVTCDVAGRGCVRTFGGT